MELIYLFLTSGLNHKVNQVNWGKINQGKYTLTCVYLAIRDTTPSIPPQQIHCLMFTREANVLRSLLPCEVVWQGSYNKFQTTSDFPTQSRTHSECCLCQWWPHLKDELSKVREHMQQSFCEKTDVLNWWQFCQMEHLFINVYMWLLPKKLT